MEECSICMEKKYTLKCHKCICHICVCCIHKLVKTSRKCPMCRIDLVLIDGLEGSPDAELLSFSDEIENPFVFEMGKRGPSRSINTLVMTLMEFATGLQIPIPPSLAQFTDNVFVVESTVEDDHMDYILHCESVIVEITRGIFGVSPLNINYCVESGDYSVRRESMPKYIKCYLCQVNVRSVDKHLLTKRHLRLIAPIE